jgi:hypothetical protein
VSQAVQAELKDAPSVGEPCRDNHEILPKQLRLGNDLESSLARATPVNIPIPKSIVRHRTSPTKINRQGAAHP